MDLQQFALERIGSDKGFLQEHEGFSQRSADYQHRLANLATWVWELWLSVRRGREHHFASVLEWGRTIVVPQPSYDRFDLVVLDPRVRSDVRLPPAAIDQSFIASVRSDLLSQMDRTGSRDEILRHVIEAALTPQQPWLLTVAPEPPAERLSVPSAPQVVSDGLGQTSTAGLLVEDLAGRRGVTAALHGVDHVAAKVSVDGRPGAIIRTDSLTDSAFIEVALSVPPTVQISGVLSGMAPRGNQSASFAGATSGHTNTIIFGWDAQVPHPTQRRQACVYTRRDAQPGDSGAALITDDGWVVGFAFERSKFNEVPAQCSWIWAESVLSRLAVKMV